MTVIAYSFLLFGLIFISSTSAAKILVVVPTPSISHQVVFRPLTQELTKRGHEVVYITTDPAFPKGKAPANLTEIDLHDFSYKTWKEFYKTSTGTKDNLTNQIKVILDLFMIVFEQQVLSEEVQKIIRNKNITFDLLLLEACVRPSLVFSHIYKVPVIQVSSLGAVFDNYRTVGAPWHPFLYPTSIRQRLYNLTIWEKLTELYEYLKFEYMYYYHEKLENDMIRKIFGPNVPTMNELKNNVQMLLLNIHPIWEGNVPVPPTVVHMGGLHQKPQKDLPKNLKKYLDSSVHGVIYISYGTNVHPSLLPQEKIQMMINVLSQLPYDVLWKWDKDELPGRSSNIKISKWFPQSDLLRHPKIKLFITQGGLQSTDEAITAGVPLIGMPMLGDQWYNVEKYVYHGIGLKLDMETLTEDVFRNAIDTILGDDSYRNKLIKLRTLMIDQPQSPLDRAIWWIEHVLRNGGANHYRSPAANMSWAQYLELDVLIILLLGFIFVFFFFAVIVYYLVISFPKYLNNFKVKKS